MEGVIGGDKKRVLVAEQVIKKKQRVEQEADGEYSVGDAVKIFLKDILKKINQGRPQIKGHHAKDAGQMHVIPLIEFPNAPTNTLLQTTAPTTDQSCLSPLLESNPTPGNGQTP